MIWKHAIAPMRISGPGICMCGTLKLIQYIWWRKKQPAQTSSFVVLELRWTFHYGCSAAVIRYSCISRGWSGGFELALWFLLCGVRRAAYSCTWYDTAAAAAPELLVRRPLCTAVDILFHACFHGVTCIHTRSRLTTHESSTYGCSTAVLVYTALTLLMLCAV